MGHLVAFRDFTCMLMDKNLPDGQGIDVEIKKLMVLGGLLEEIPNDLFPLLDWHYKACKALDRPVLQKAFNFKSKFSTYDFDGQRRRLGCPAAVAVDRSNNIYVCDKMNHRVPIFQKDGTFLAYLGLSEERRHIGRPVAISIGTDGTIMVLASSSSTLEIFSPTWEYQRSLSVGQEIPSDVTSDREGNAIVAESGAHRIRVYSPTGDFIRDIAPKTTEVGYLHEPTGVALTPEGNYVVCDRWAHELKIFTPEGSLLSVIGVQGLPQSKKNCQFRYPWGVALDRHGCYVVSDTENSRIQVLSPEGKFLFKFGQKGTADGQMGSPHHLTINWDGDIVYADSLTNSICTFGIREKKTKGNPK